MDNIIKFICFFIAFAIFILSCFVRKKKSKYNEINNNIISILSLLIATVGVLSGLADDTSTTYTYNSSEQSTISNESYNSGNIDNSINIDSNNTNNVINNNTILEDSSTSPGTLLNYARIYYNSGLYEKMAKIYADERLENNYVAQNNLGYMYANGIFFEQNFSEAAYYYDKAISLGCQQAYNNKIAMYLREHLDNISEVILQGLEIDNQNIMFFISQMFPIGELISDPIARKATLTYFCFELSTEAQQNILDSYCYQEWGEPVYVEPDYITKNNFMTKYVPYTDRENLQGFISHIYEKYKRKCKNIEFFNEMLIFE